MGNWKKVFSMLADTIVFEGTKEKCEEYIKKYSHSEDSLYIIN